VTLVFVVWAAYVYLWQPFGVSEAPPHDGYVRVPGVVHVHTTLSDGGGTSDEVIGAAQAAGLKFVAITDHNNLDAKPSEGYRNGVLVIVGTEVSTTEGHILGLGIPDPLYRLPGSAHDALADIRELGGLAFAAHPVSPRADFRWTGWNEPGPWGIELLNGDSQWRSAGGGRLLRTVVSYGLNRRYALLTSLTPPDEALARWDALLRERDVVGIVGADAHSRLPLRRDSSVRFPSYEALFGLSRNYVLLEAPLTGRADEDTSAIVNALARGHCYVGLEALAPAHGFSFVARAGDRRWTMGDTVPAQSGLTLEAGGALPARATVRLLRDGLPLREQAGALVQENVGPGVYRVEVRVAGWDVPWILTNPIYVADDATAARRKEHAAVPQEPLPTTATVLDSFDGPTPFNAEADPTSKVDTTVIDPHGGGDGRGAARLAFRLAAPTAAQRHTHCALIDRTARDLRGRHGLVFKIRSDRDYRIELQVRDENPASADDREEWWFGSVRTTPEWRTVAVPFARLRSINPKTDGVVDLDKIRALVFVLDQGSIKTGTAGTIWIDALGAY
jgi:hypothetical protein